jgi:putative spermidine/putrescine transport system substrate-binding protein
MESNFYKNYTIRLSTLIFCVWLLTVLPASAADILHISNPGGQFENAMVKAFYKPFEEETGVKISYSANPSASLSHVKVQVETGNVEWDLWITGKANSLAAGELGLLEKIEWNRIDTRSLIEDALGDYFMGICMWGVAMAWNTEKFSEENHPNNWQDFWNVKKFPGRRGLYAYWFDTLEIALLADGVPANKLYPLDVERAFKNLEKIRPDIHVWWKRGAQATQLMADREVDLIATWNGRIQAAIESGAPFQIEWNQGFYNFDGFLMLKGTKKKDLAYKFLNYVATHPKRNAVFAQEMAYGPVNKSAYEYIPEARAKVLCGYPPNLKNMIPLNNEYRSAKKVELTERWNKWMAE